LKKVDQNQKAKKNGSAISTVYTSNNNEKRKHMILHKQVTMAMKQSKQILLRVLLV